MRITTSMCPGRSRLLAAIAAAVSLAVVAPAAHANLIQNGGFETGNFTNWTVTGNLAIASNPYFGAGTAANGKYFAVFNSGDTAPNGVLSQTVTSVAGHNYTLSFAYGSGQNGGFQSMMASATDSAGSMLGSLFDTATTANAFMATTFTFRADSTATTISFADYPGNYTISNDGFLDNVSVSAVAEPTSLALLATGLVGATLRRRRKTG